jgi:hypothetical protein
VAKQREPVREREAGGSRPHGRGAAAGGRGAREHRRARLGEMRIRRMALQQADLDGLVLVGVAHAGLLAQDLRRADTGAHAAEDVLLQDGPGGAAQIVLGDALDEGRDVDPGGARGDARRVVAVVAAIGLDQRLDAIERRMGLAEIARVFLLAQSARPDPVPVAHRRSPGAPRKGRVTHCRVPGTRTARP